MEYEKIFTEINGSEQGMFLQSDNPEKPVLLFLHGGPGSPEVAMNVQKPSGLEKLFTVCWWEQRGCGISLNNNTKEKEMTLDQIILDTVEVSKYLQKRYNKEKIYLMGHSWGTLLGSLTATKYPELFEAYIGIGQIKQIAESEYLGYVHMKEEYKRLSNTKMFKKFDKISMTKDSEPNMKYLATLRSKCLNELGLGLFHKNASLREVIKDSISFKGYTLIEKFKFLCGSMFSIKTLWNNIYSIDLAKEATDFKIPVYIFHGKYDFQVSYTLSKEYFETINAPVKGFYTFEESAHSPCFEEPEKMISILQTDILGKIS